MPRVRLVSMRSRSEEQAISLAVVLGVIGGMLGGCMYSLASVAPAVRAIGHVVPQAWAMDAFVKLIYDHEGLGAVLPEIGVLALFAAVLSALALRAYAGRCTPPGESAGSAGGTSRCGPATAWCCGRGGPGTSRRNRP